MVQEGMISQEESQWRNKVCLQLGGNEKQLIALKDHTNELKGEMKELAGSLKFLASSEEVKVLAGKIDDLMKRPLPCHDRDENKQCEPVKLMKEVQRKVIGYAFGSGVVTFGLIELIKGLMKK